MGRSTRLFASTWNVGGVAPPDDLDLSDWLDTRNGTYDIYVLGYVVITQRLTSMLVLHSHVMHG